MYATDGSKYVYKQSNRELLVNIVNDELVNELFCHNNPKSALASRSWLKNIGIFFKVAMNDHYQRSIRHNA